jgi:hypothetical protein
MIKVHVHDNSEVPVAQSCRGEFTLSPDKILTLHMHDGGCRLCTEGHCHEGSIALVLADGQLFVVFEGVRPPGRITHDDYRPAGRISH